MVADGATKFPSEHIRDCPAISHKSLTLRPAFGWIVRHCLLTTEKAGGSPAAIELRLSLRVGCEPRAAEKTWALPTGKMPSAFPTLPQLRRRDGFAESSVRNLGAGQFGVACFATGATQARAWTRSSVTS